MREEKKKIRFSFTFSINFTAENPRFYGVNKSMELALFSLEFASILST